MQPRESNGVISNEWSWSTFKGFGLKTWPKDTRRNADSETSVSCKTINESVQCAGRQKLFLTRIRTFRAWTVKLNGEKELVVEGRLECGLRARSKPIAERVTATKILSKMKHVYHLIGDITDPQYELPEFIRNTFNAGFPQNWDTVVAIWKGFASPGGSLDLTTGSSYTPGSFVSEKKLRLDISVEYESQDDRMSRTMSDVKQLSSWMPFVVTNAAGESCLAFRGTLLSFMGYCVDANYETNIIFRRLSARIVETVDRKFYELIGNLNNTKRSVPKELVTLCRNGCPKEVYLFCEKWKLLKGEETQFNRSLPNGKRKQRTRQDRSISLITTCHEESINFNIDYRCDSTSLEQSIGGPLKRKRPFMELSENCITSDASIDNDADRDKNLGTRKQYKMIRTIPPTNSSETSSVDKEDIAKDERSKLFKVRPIVRKKTKRRTSPLKPIPSISIEYYKICPPIESVLSDGV